MDKIRNASELDGLHDDGHGDVLLENDKEENPEGSYTTPANPFAKSSRMSRSPIRVQRSLSVGEIPRDRTKRREDISTDRSCKSVERQENSVVILSSPEEMSERKKKRGKTKPTEEELKIKQELEYLNEIVASLSRNIIEVCKVVKENTNTKKEIKEIVARMKDQANRLNTNRVGGFLTKLVEDKLTILREEGIAKTARLEYGKEKIGTQIGQPKAAHCEGQWEKRCQELEVKCAKLAKENHELKEELGKELGKKQMDVRQLKECDSYKDFEKIAKLHWQDKTFKRAFIIKGNPIKANKDTDLLVLNESRNAEGYQPIQGKDKSRTPSGNGAINKIFEDRYPELKDIEEKVGIIITNTKIIRGKEEICSERWIFRADLENEEEDWFETIKIIEDKMEKANRRKIAVYPPTGDREGCNLPA